MAKRSDNIRKTKNKIKINQNKAEKHTVQKDITSNSSCSVFCILLFQVFFLPELHKTTHTASSTVSKVTFPLKAVFSKFRMQSLPLTQFQLR